MPRGDQERKPLGDLPGKAPGPPLRGPPPGDRPASRPAILPATFLALASALLAPRSPAGEAPPYLSAIASREDFDAVSIPAGGAGDVERTTKFLLPARDDPALLGPLFQDVGVHRMHEDFLRAVFPDRFPGLTNAEYRSLVEVRATRSYFAGSLSRIATPAGARIYGFTVFTDPSPAEILRVEEARAVHAALSAAFFEPGLLHYAPEGAIAKAQAAGWGDPGFPVYLGGSTGARYAAYTKAVGYGRVRNLELAELAEAVAAGRVSWQDVLVLDGAPRDIEGVVAGVVTAEPQGELSHVAVRTARRGTPNAFLSDAAEVFGPLEGRLVRIEVAEWELRVAEATLEEAEAWWRDHRPALSRAPELDPEHEALDALGEIDLSGAAGRPESRFGGKAANLARLRAILTGPRERYREAGFAIPVRYYIEFLERNSARSAIDPGRRVSYATYLEELLSDERFRSDPGFRHGALAAFRGLVEDGSVDAELIGRIIARIQEVFGSAERMVRFRSSSNVEDILEFNGAGLYESTSACAADDLDGDVVGPSWCDPLEPGERGIARALKKVWASLWTYRAFEERSYYGIDQGGAGMAVLVTGAFLGEEANGVAFTGNPANALDRRYVVVAQAGEESVVMPEPGTRPEKDILEVEGGEVRRIVRAQRSSFLPAGDVVLSDATLEELGSLLAHIHREMPVDLAGHRRDDVIFDVEFKVERGGSLAVKQVRPFLLSEPGGSGPTFALEVPEGTVLSGAFVDGRPPEEEYAAKSRLRLVPGRHELPTSAPSFGGRLVEGLVVGPGRIEAQPLVPGRFDVSVEADGRGNATYGFTYRETFTVREGGDLGPGEELLLELQVLDARVEGGLPVEETIELDERYIVERLVLLAVPAGDPGRIVRYSSSTYETVPLWEGRAEIEGGDVVTFRERYREALVGSGPASLVGAEVAIGGERREVRDYWDLVYSAQHHNVGVRYWILLSPPIEAPGIGGVHAVALDAPFPEEGLPAAVRYLGAGFETIARPRVVCFLKALEGELGSCGFRRGDVDSSGRVSITDAIALLDSLFRGGPPPPCPDAADFDDDGVVEIADAVLILSYLFRGLDLSGPPGPVECGVDPTPDGLGECRYRACP